MHLQALKYAKKKYNATIILERGTSQVIEQVKVQYERTASPTYEKAIAIRWLFEELRVSVFAQELGTIDKVSVPRIESLLGKLD